MTTGNKIDYLMSNLIPSEFSWSALRNGICIRGNKVFVTHRLKVKPLTSSDIGTAG